MTVFNNRATGENIEISDTGFNPTSANYGGSAYQFQKTNPDTGEVNRVSRGVANLMGSTTAFNVQDKVPSGSSTDFTSNAGDKKPWGFTPNQPGGEEGSWN